VRTKVCDLPAIEHPILNAPMALVAEARIAATGSERGGLGMTGGGSRDPAGLRSEIDAAHALTDKPVGVGLTSHLAEANDLTTAAPDAASP
jgi:NAD(P)H-dependent flavin oxidoreductase YrpB (nitropropane dioxygenase family)